MMIILYLIYFLFQNHYNLISKVAEVKVGAANNEISIHLNWPGDYLTSFTIDQSENFWLIDEYDKSIKAFNSKGIFLYLIQPINKKAYPVKLNTWMEYLIVLNNYGYILVYDKNNGNYLAKMLIDIKNINPAKSYFYGNNLFVIQDFTSIGNLYQIEINIEKSFENHLMLFVRPINYTGGADGFRNRTYYLPIDSLDNEKMRGVDITQFKGKSNEYVLLQGANLNEKYEFTYFIYIKKSDVFKQIGVIPEKLTGQIITSWWGDFQLINNNLYMTGVMYKNMKFRSDPQKIILSKIKLENLEELPTVTIDHIISRKE